MKMTMRENLEMAMNELKEKKKAKAKSQTLESIRTKLSASEAARDILLERLKAADRLLEYTGHQETCVVRSEGRCVCDCGYEGLSAVYESLKGGGDLQTPEGKE